MKRWLTRAGVILVLALITIQFVPIEQTNPLVESDVAVPAELKVVLRRSCYDCHSNETRWPWYARVAPVSWLIANDVKEGRRQVNFSVWNQYGGNRKARKLKEIVDQVEQNKMPQWYYLLVHPDATQSAENKEMIIRWAKQR
jgi:cbb3-type cytochrome oxidase cytochrome c subunit